MVINFLKNYTFCIRDFGTCKVLVEIHSFYANDFFSMGIALKEKQNTLLGEKPEALNQLLCSDTVVLMTSYQYFYNPLHLFALCQKVFVKEKKKKSSSLRVKHFQIQFSSFRWSPLTGLWREKQTNWGSVCKVITFAWVAQHLWARWQLSLLIQIVSYDVIKKKR